LTARTEHPPRRSEPGDESTGTNGESRAERRRRQDAALRASLTPLARGERPPALIAAIVVALLLAVAIAIGTATIHDLSRHGGSIPGGVFLSAVLIVLAAGMYRQRYWAVVGFEALLVFQLLLTALALVLASTIYAALGCVIGLALGGWLFWKLIRVMGRLQAGEIAHTQGRSYDRVE
jgi:hypothetical protein